MKPDHLFIGTHKIEEALAAVCECGFVPGSSNRHPGQGTANRRFFFRNLMLELLYVEDAAEAAHPRNHLLRLPQRCAAHAGAGSVAGAGAGAAPAPPISPLGVCFRPVDSARQEPLFEAHRYTPGYLPPELHINVASEDCPADPLWFHLPFATDDMVFGKQEVEPLEHGTGVSRVTSIEVQIASSELSVTARIADSVPGLHVCCGDEPLLTLEFDQRQNAQQRDFRPLLPLIMAW
ncbi:MAG: VOC family protein [Gammaproteobacteria bacterium]|nr:VOC family protein [Gammaproteobacteria bacterium]